MYNLTSVYKIILLVSILALSVIFKSFSDNKKKESEKVEIIDTASLAYRVEEPHNLIVEEQANLVETEEEFTNYIATINEDVEFIVNKEIVTEKEKLTLKNTFITLTDFIFYGTEIKQYLVACGKILTCTHDFFFAIYRKCAKHSFLCFNSQHIKHRTCQMFAYRTVCI